MGLRIFIEIQNFFQNYQSKIPIVGKTGRKLSLQPIGQSVFDTTFLQNKCPNFHDFFRFLFDLAFKYTIGQPDKVKRKLSEAGLL